MSEDEEADVTTVTVEILHTEGCADWRAARATVQSVAEVLGCVVTVTETLVTSSADAERLRFPGSPTVRVNGVDLQPDVAEAATFGLG